MKINIPDKHLTISNILMGLTLFAVAGGAIGVLLQQVLMLVITVAVLAAFALAIYAIWQVIRQSGGVLVSYEDPTEQTIRHVHTVRHVHTFEQPQQRMIEQQPQRYTVLQPSQQRQQLPVERARLEVRR